MEALRAALRANVTAEMAVDPGHDLAHLDRVWVTVQAIAKAEGRGDIRVLLAAAYLHDLVNVPKNSPDRANASRMSAAAAAPVLAGLGFADAEIAKAQHAIAAHSYSAALPVESIEAAILRDADRLDAIGAIGIARAFRVSAGLGQAIYDPGDPFAEGRELDDGPFAIDHWRIKLLGLRDGMLTDAGRAMAETRLSFMQDYLRQLARELGRDLPENWLT
ncbi:hydrolase [Actibacterium mucosum KCTC 23349]|uniref:Hydrolase n=1 Tax=Actibacterium mucosum KCTC 23349 TaxID=1454373 RepID=A0A037ZKZ5_9RHOB|nr:HD domain-containing protein [Actibacterium mucosum]KAJ57121.1 hydrolase [Actibacterium mucosum KCTC 23349]